MAEREWRRDEESRRYGRGESSQQAQRWGSGESWGRPSGVREGGFGARPDWQDQADGDYQRPERWSGDDRDRGPSDAHYGQYAGSQYGGVSSAGRGYPESDVMPRRGDWSPRQSNRQPPGRGQNESWRGQGQSGSWRGSGSSGQDDRDWNEPSWGNAGSYGRSQGAGSYGAGTYGRSTGSEWQTGGGGGSTSFQPRDYDVLGQPRPSYLGRGPKGYTRSDDRIREQVSERLEEDPTVDASDITVSVQGGEVTLTGTVSSRDQKRRAEDCVESAGGVREVINNVRVRRSGDSQSETLSASEQSSSVLGLGGQPSREDEEKAVTDQSGTGKNAGKRTATTSGGSS